MGHVATARVWRDGYSHMCGLTDRGVGHNYIGHTYIGHHYIGHTYIGHNYTGVWRDGYRHACGVTDRDDDQQAAVGHKYNVDRSRR